MHRQIAKDIHDNGLYCDQCGECDGAATEYFHWGTDEKFCSLKCAEENRAECDDVPPHELEASLPISKVEL